MVDLESVEVLIAFVGINRLFSSTYLQTLALNNRKSVLVVCLLSIRDHLFSSNYPETLALNDTKHQLSTQINLLQTTKF